jgi:hypothetical protein
MLTIALLMGDTSTISQSQFLGMAAFCVVIDITNLIGGFAIGRLTAGKKEDE